MITKGYVLIHSNLSSHESENAIIVFSEDKNELDKIADDKNKSSIKLFNEFISLSEDIKIYKEKFENFQKFHDCEISKIDFQKWRKENPVPAFLNGFIKFHEFEREKYNVYLDAVQEQDLRDYYYVESLEPDPGIHSNY